MHNLQSRRLLTYALIFHRLCQLEDMEEDHIICEVEDSMPVMWNLKKADQAACGSLAGHRLLSVLQS